MVGSDLWARLRRCVLLVFHKLVNFVAGFSTRNVTAVNGDEIKPFSAIPGPGPAFPIIGTQWIYSFLGPYSLEKLHVANEDKFHKYGPVVVEYSLWKFPIVHLYDKKDIEEVLRYPSKAPVRPSLEPQLAYRLSRPDRYKSVGLVNAQGSEWNHLRNLLTPYLQSSKVLSDMSESMSSISEELCHFLRRKKSPDGTITSFEKYIYRHGLEMIINVLLGKKMGYLEDNIPPLAERLMIATDNLFQVCHEAMYGFPWWKYLPSKSYTNLVECEDTIYDVFETYIDELIEELKQLENSGSLGQEGQRAIMSEMLTSDSIDRREKIAAVIDFISAGIETSGNSAIYLLYNISQNPEVLERVYEELDRVAPPGTPITSSLIRQLPYLRACVNESFRLNPIAPNVARLTEQDMVFQNYKVPKNSLVVCETWVACLQEKNFQRPREFVPERWLGDSSAEMHSFLLVPFGAGRRICPGRRLALLELNILVANILQSFRVTFTKPLESVYKFLITPKGPIDVILEERTVTN